MTERKRERGFALMDAAFAADPKFLRLQRKAPDPTAYAACVGVYWLLVADARRNRSPEVNWDDYEEYTEQVALLQEVRLLTDSGFEPETFERWAPAYRSPWDRTRGTQGDAEVREGTQEYAASTHLISTPITSTNGVGGVGEGEKPRVFMTFPPKKAKPLTQKEIESFRRSATEGLDPLVKANARQALEKAGIPIEETRPS